MLTAHANSYFYLQIGLPSSVAPLQPSNPSPLAGVPAYTLITAHTVRDVWREYKEGVAGGPAVEQLERDWQSRWRPTAAQRTAWSRRKTLLDEVKRLVAAGLTPADAVAELEAQRGSSTLRSLIDALVEKRHQPGQRRRAGRPQSKV
jgi:Transcriptional activator of glycolytic enzymes